MSSDVILNDDEVTIQGLLHVSGRLTVYRVTASHLQAGKEVSAEPFLIRDAGENH
jgi:hypothetical protein